MRCKSCNALCISTHEMYSEQVCYYCYTSFSNLLVKHWKKIFKEVDGSATIEMKDPIMEVMSHDENLARQNEYPVNPILMPREKN